MVLDHTSDTAPMNRRAPNATKGIPSAPKKAIAAPPMVTV
jgi:hypothetical protein